MNYMSGWKADIRPFHSASWQSLQLHTKEIQDSASTNRSFYNVGPIKKNKNKQTKKQNKIKVIRSLLDVGILTHISVHLLILIVGTNIDVGHLGWVLQVCRLAVPSTEGKIGTSLGLEITFIMFLFSWLTLGNKPETIWYYWPKLRGVRGHVKPAHFC